MSIDFLRNQKFCKYYSCYTFKYFNIFHFFIIKRKCKVTVNNNTLGGCTKNVYVYVHLLTGSVRYKRSPKCFPLVKIR